MTMLIEDLQDEIKNEGKAEEETQIKYESGMDKAKTLKGELGARKLTSEKRQCPEVERQKQEANEKFGVETHTWECEESEIAGLGSLKIQRWESVVVVPWPEREEVPRAQATEARARPARPSAPPPPPPPAPQPVAPWKLKAWRGQQKLKDQVSEQRSSSTVRL